jgi:hypothetical protein
MYLKIMNDEHGAPDSDSRSTFTLHDHVTACDISRDDDGKATLYVTFEKGPAESYDCPGNAYLMNNEGKTIASFGGAPYVPTRGRD